MSTPLIADYGPRARVGVATPQANPTVEPEIRELLPDAIGVYATRLVFAAPQVEDRLNHYIRHMADAVRSFGAAHDFRGMKDVADRTTFLVERGGTVRGAWRHDPGEVPDFDELLAAARAL